MEVHASAYNIIQLNKIKLLKSKYLLAVAIVFLMIKETYTNLAVMSLLTPGLETVTKSRLKTVMTCDWAVNGEA